MFWFWNRQVKESVQRAIALVHDVISLRAEVAAIVAEVRSLRLEWAEASDRIYRHMKRGEQAARKVAAPSGGILGVRSPDDPPEIASSTPLRGRRSVWGARGRRAQRPPDDPHNGGAAGAADEGA